jgi:uncharacterized protein (DUF1015 family)
MGLYHPGRPDGSMSIATLRRPDPLAAWHPDRSPAWRELDVALVQHLLVEQICRPAFSPDRDVKWKFPHDLTELKAVTDGGGYELGVVLQPTPLEAIKSVCEARELMPQKSTFFYPKLATGLVINPVGE